MAMNLVKQKALLPTHQAPQAKYSPMLAIPTSKYHAGNGYLTLVLSTPTNVVPWLVVVTACRGFLELLSYEDIHSVHLASKTAANAPLHTTIWKRKVIQGFPWAVDYIKTGLAATASLQTGKQHEPLVAKPQLMSSQK
ncbi:hypothetical protein NW768_002182 [Fusarium equiseti]|uniref:Uncharacterized protein n=1 Tax=Fusarium equiseti TaxID=61235 RepID=A0ABQ8RN05_FUSEQ|nr:hypothetical protein NW768_002182 [Fusarium equiseti]